MSLAILRRCGLFAKARLIMAILFQNMVHSGSRSCPKLDVMNVMFKSIKLHCELTAFLMAVVSATCKVS